jgi:hypothetical protein
MAGSQAYFGAYRGKYEEDDQQPVTGNQLDADCPTARGTKAREEERCDKSTGHQFRDVAIVQKCNVSRYETARPKVRARRSGTGSGLAAGVMITSWNETTSFGPDSFRGRKVDCTIEDRDSRHAFPDYFGGERSPSLRCRGAAILSWRAFSVPCSRRDQTILF